MYGSGAPDSSGAAPSIRDGVGLLALVAAFICCVRAVESRESVSAVLGGMAVLMLGVHICTKYPVWIRVVAVLPGATIVAARLGSAVAVEWARVIPIALAAGAIVGRNLGNVIRQGPIEAITLSLISLGGIYACVPETDHLQELAVAAVCLIAVALVTPEYLGPEILVGWAVVLGWAIAYGGSARASSLVGGIGSLGILLADPVIGLLPSPRIVLTPSQPISTLLRMGLQAAHALIVSRTAGLGFATGRSVVIAATTFAALLVTTRAIRVHDGGSILIGRTYGQTKPVAS